MLIIIVTMLVFTLISVYAIRHSSKQSYILDKKLNGVVAGLSAGATTSSGFSFMAMVGTGYTMGVSALLFPVSSLIGHLIFWTFVADKLVKKSHKDLSLSVPELVVSNISKKAKSNELFLKFIAGFICISLIIFLMAQFAAVEKAVSIFTTLDPVIPMLTILAFVIIYSSIGGFIGSVFTDVAQAIIMLILAIGMLLWVGFNFDTSFATIAESNPELLSWNGKMTTISGVLTIISFVILGFVFSMSQPQVTARVMAIKDKSQINIAKIIYITFTQINFMGMVLLGFMARFILDGVEDPEMILPQIAQQNFHPIIIVCVMVGLLSAIISTLDSLLVSIANSISYDILGFGRKDKRKHNLFHNRLIMVIVGFVAISLSYIIPASVFSLGMLNLNLLVGSIGVAMTITIFASNIKAEAIIIAVLTGTITTVLWKFFGNVTGVSEGMVGYILGLFAYVMLNKVLKLGKKSKVMNTSKNKNHLANTDSEGQSKF
ncbi:MAG: hypothetical protein GY793_01060 [Proteobacteria bacterium]|nr:hypothetical protein [Pseudomonadota bacterium]